MSAHLLEGTGVCTRLSGQEHPRGFRSWAKFQSQRKVWVFCLFFNHHPKRSTPWHFKYVPVIHNEPNMPSLFPWINPRYIGSMKQSTWVWIYQFDKKEFRIVVHQLEHPRLCAYRKREKRERKHEASGRRPAMPQSLSLPHTSGSSLKSWSDSADLWQLWTQPAKKEAEANPQSEP